MTQTRSRPHATTLARPPASHGSAAPFHRGQRRGPPGTYRLRSVASMWMTRLEPDVPTCSSEMVDFKQKLRIARSAYKLQVYISLRIACFSIELIYFHIVNEPQNHAFTSEMVDFQTAFPSLLLMSSFFPFFCSFSVSEYLSTN